MTKQIAIKGHPTRGNEVIEILEMLGGKNVYILPGDTTYAYYVLESGEIHCGTYIYGNEPYTIFTLEEFINKYPFKVGDKAISNDGKKIVDIVGLEWDESVGDLCYKVTKNNEDYIWFTSEFIKLYRKQTLQEQIDDSFIQLNQNISQMNECACNISTEIIKKEIAKKQEILIGLVPVKQGKELIPHEDYKIKQIENKFYLVKKNPTYPKTYKECCDVLEIGTLSNDVSGWKEELLISFQELLIARDAYWKIAGEEMGMDKPWEPDWNYETDKYCIYCNNKTISKDIIFINHNIFLHHLHNE